MAEELANGYKVDALYNDIVQLIDNGKKSVVRVVNDAMITLYWNIGKTINDDILCGDRASYGDAIVAELSNRLSERYGKGFKKTSLFRMMKFYQEFPDFEIVATLSQQLTWSHFIELLPIEEPLKRDFYAAMCKNEGWSVRTLRERKKSMLYERTAISKKPEETVANEIAELRDERKMTPDFISNAKHRLDDSSID